MMLYFVCVTNCHEARLLWVLFQRLYFYLEFEDCCYYWSVKVKIQRPR